MDEDGPDQPGQPPDQPPEGEYVQPEAAPPRYFYDDDDPPKRRSKRRIPFAFVGIVGGLSAIVVFGIFAAALFLGGTFPPTFPSIAVAGAESEATAEAGSAAGDPQAVQTTAAPTATPTPNPSPTPTKDLPPAPAPASDVPAPPNAELLQLTTAPIATGMSTATARYQSLESAETIVDFYRKEMDGRGWTEAAGSTDLRLSYFRDDDGVRRTVVISLEETGAWTIVTIEVDLIDEK